MKKAYYIFLTFLLVLPLTSFAAQVVYTYPMVVLPGYSDTAAAGDFDDFINLIYGLAISLAALLAVVKIVIAGVKWMLSDIVTDKTEAKKDIQSALFGLIIIISAVLIITVINPNII